MADVLRHEIIVNEGGFYFDTSMLLFKPIPESWLTYEFVIGSERVFRHRWSMNMCMLAAKPGFKGIVRKLARNNTNTYNLFLKNVCSYFESSFSLVLLIGYNNVKDFYLVDGF